MRAALNKIAPAAAALVAVTALWCAARAIAIRAPLVGPGDVVALSPDAVRARLGDRAATIVRVLDWAPHVVTLLAIVLAALAAGAARRRRAVEYARALAADPFAQKLGATLALAAVIWRMIAPLLQPGFYAC